MKHASFPAALSALVAAFAALSGSAIMAEPGIAAEPAVAPAAAPMPSGPQAHAGFSDYLADMPRIPAFFTYERNHLIEVLFQMPAALADQDLVTAQVSRINAEVRDALYLRARQDRAAGETGRIGEAGRVGEAERAGFKPWMLGLQWVLEGSNARFASLSAAGAYFPRSVPGNMTVMALVVDRQNGRFVTAANDMFDDNMAAARPLYCALLDIQRVANALEADPDAGRGGKLIVDEAGVYQGKWPCPQFDELAISFRGAAGQPFDRIQFDAAPGVAGPAQEGFFRVNMNITPRLLDQIKPQYRSGFRAFPAATPPNESAP